MKKALSVSARRLVKAKALVIVFSPSVLISVKNKLTQRRCATHSSVPVRERINSRLRSPGIYLNN